MPDDAKRRPAGHKSPRSCRGRSPLGRLLANARARHAHTKNAASKALRCSPSTITNWEEKGIAPSRKQMADLALYADVPLSTIERLAKRVAG